MPELLPDDVRDQLRTRLASLEGPVRLVHFTQRHACGRCAQQRELLEAIAGLSDKLTLEVHELVDDAPIAARFGVDKVPATAVVGDRDRGIRFYGLTGGYELGSLLEAIETASTGDAGLSPELRSLAERITVPVHLEIMVTLGCPYCPRMVRLAHQLAFVNEQVRGDMIDAAEFPTLVQRYEVNGVPRTVINERPGFEGALPAPTAILEILKAVDRPEYDRLDAAIREARGERSVHEVEPGHTYDVIIVGAGPAGLSAAVYAARKDLDVALVARDVGGQITNTATVENWLGQPSVGGDELAMMFRDHAEHYPLAEQMGVTVKAIRRDGSAFIVETASDGELRALAVIYTAGKQYRRLGVPGEERFLGRGVAFCATCDAPLFRDQRVAVIGGGNSAFSAARDLLSYASEIHVIDIAPAFIADPVLLEEVRGSAKVHLHSATRVLEYLGRERLQGIRLARVDGSDRFDLLVDGVFLEIGLVPNAEPVKGLVELNAAGEIPVDRDQATAVPGLFAAGDVTDEREKQIIVAAGAG
ncbi:MAG: FAD-dependent oxidoreductase, partial [Myxococcales bacterium]|nr:FAD-dependent oxidoreductase [Myxococcales bacterium]